MLNKTYSALLLCLSSAAMDCLKISFCCLFVKSHQSLVLARYPLSPTFKKSGAFIVYHKRIVKSLLSNQTTCMHLASYYMHAVITVDRLCDIMDSVFLSFTLLEYILDILRDLFYTWRPYKVHFEREVQGS